MNIDASTITAASGFLVGLLGVLISLYTARNSAQRSEVQSLRDTITSLQVENQRLSKRLVEVDVQSQERIDEMEQLVEAREARVSALEEQVRLRDRRIDELERSLREATVARNDRMERIRELESEVAQLRSQVQALENDRAGGAV